ncbi:putative premnaspirodiene oxygenase [Rosa chinensis]|uniref:Putative premnaspirodiene oxygenase n=1 Tax=Rosa chinensis TaxID=74649 RepID=A0A2P6S6G7_ROSCH|nr:desmethyl-deoxy-podophyllotoxin synthase [Rosa chinensis]PRQ54275.1 putative premnaspirodiene oxygenase [Rosa chinensis]
MASPMSLLMLQIPYFPLFTSLLILVISWKKYKARSGSNPKSPPGPWKLPIIGNLHQLAAGNPLPHHALRDLAKKHGPIMHLKLGQVEATVISSSKAAEEVLKTHELTFAQRPLVLAVEVLSFAQSSIVFSPYGDYWRQMRKVCVLKLFNTKRVQSFRSIREEEVLNFIESIHSTSSKGLTPINFSEKISSLTNGIVSRAALGQKCKDEKEFTSLLEEATQLAAGFDIPDLFPSLRFLGYVTGTIPKMKKMRNKLGKILERIINDHKIKSQGSEVNKPEEDFVDVLLKLQESKELEVTTDQIKDVIMDVFSAGSETTATAIEWAMSELMRNPRVMNKAQAEIRKLLQGKPKIEEAADVIQNLDYLKAVVKETLRLHPPAPLLPRESRERCEISGYELPEKAKVIINEWAIGRDPESWVDAESFKPERFLHGSESNVDFKGFDFQFIPFGAGRRICPGMSFGVPIIEVVLSQLLYHFDWELGNGIKAEELDMSETFGISCRRKHDLYVIATPHPFPSLNETL